MNAGFYFLLAALWLNTLSIACAQTAKSLLWKVSGKDIVEPSYLFGTYHLLCEDDAVLPSALQDALAETKTLYLELDLGDPNIAVSMIKSMEMRGDTSFRDLYGPAEYDSVSTLLESIAGMSLEMMDHFKPMVAYSAVMPSLMDCNPSSMELSLSNKAKELNIPVKGLETVAFQASLFDSIPYSIQAAQLKEMLYNSDGAKRDFLALIDLYKQEDIKALHDKVVEEELLVPYTNTLVYNRNRNWVGIIQQQAAQQPAFFAFGAGHLGGELGVINLLIRAGYDVEPVMEHK